MPARIKMPVPSPLITASADVLSGTPVFTGTRVPVKTLFDYIEAGDAISEFLVDFPNVSHDHAVAVLNMARDAAINAALRTAAE